MNKTLRFMAVPVLALSAVALAGSPAVAAEGSYQTTFDQLNGSSGAGSATVDVSGNQAHAVVSVSGLPETFMDAPYPHVQHIHAGAQGECPTAGADANGDGVVSTTEGEPFYGPVTTTISTSGDTSAKAALNLKTAGMGGSYTVDRTFTLNAETKAAIADGTAVVVVHGLDPVTLSAEAQKAKSDLDPKLPLAATSPALCGTLAASQMSMPEGGADTGVPQAAAEETSVANTGMLALGGGLVLAAVAGGTYVVRRRKAGQAA